MPRMILAHPRSRSHLLGSSYSNYVSEIFSPMHIAVSQFYKDNRDMTISGGHGQDSPFADAYIAHLRELYRDKEFTFKVHYCSIKNWLAAKNLIAEWKPEIVACHRADKKMAVLSYLLALHDGFTSFHKNHEGKPFTAKYEEFLRAWNDVVEDWDEGLNVYTPDFWYEYDGVPARIDLKYQFQKDRIQAFHEECKYKEQHSKRKLFKILNLQEVGEWFDEKAKERIKNAFTAHATDHTTG